jgi:hypothetical protein
MRQTLNHAMQVFSCYLKKEDNLVSEILTLFNAQFYPRRVEGIYKEYIQTTYTSQIDKDIVTTYK